VPLSLLLTVLILLAALGYWSGRRRALDGARSSGRRLPSLAGYYGWYVALWTGLPSLVILVAWAALSEPLYDAMIVSALPDGLKNLPKAELELVLSEVRNRAAGVMVSVDKPGVAQAAERLDALRSTGFLAATGAAISLALAGFVLAWRRVQPAFRARVRVETAFRWIILLCSTVAIFTTIGIVLSLLFEAVRFFRLVSPAEFLFGLDWSPQTAIRADQVGSSGAFGAVPVFAGTLMITAIAMLVAVPIGLMSAIFMSEYATPRLRSVAKPVLEILAGVPTVVFGFFAALTVAPLIRGFGGAIGLDVSSESALAAGLVMGVMIIPFVSSLSDDVINAVPQNLRDGAYALGATKSETIRQVVLPAALPGVVGAILLAVSRAIGETMIVVMAAGLAANLTADPFEAVTTVTVQIVTLLVGDQEFDSAKTLAAFALGLTLFIVTLMLNVLALRIVQRYREKYD